MVLLNIQAIVIPIRSGVSFTTQAIGEGKTTKGILCRAFCSQKLPPCQKLEVSCKSTTGMAVNLKNTFAVPPRRALPIEQMRIPPSFPAHQMNTCVCMSGFRTSISPSQRQGHAIRSFSSSCPIPDEGNLKIASSIMLCDTSQVPFERRVWEDCRQYGI